MTLDRYKHLADKKLGEKRGQLDAVDALRPIAEELGCTLAQVRLHACHAGCCCVARGLRSSGLGGTPCPEGRH